MNDSDKEWVRQEIAHKVDWKIDDLHQIKHDSIETQINSHHHCADCGRVYTWNVLYWPANKWNGKLCRDCNLRHEGPVTEKKK